MKFTIKFEKVKKAQSSEFGCWKSENTATSSLCPRLSEPSGHYITTLSLLRENHKSPNHKNPTNYKNTNTKQVSPLFFLTE